MSDEPLVLPTQPIPSGVSLRTHTSFILVEYEIVDTNGVVVGKATMEIDLHDPNIPDILRDTWSANTASMATYKGII